MSWHPHRGAAGTPGFTGPSFIAGLTRRGHGIGAPYFLASFCVQCHDEAANAQFTARRAHQDLAVNGERRHGDVVAEVVVLDSGIPGFPAGGCVQCDDPGIQSGGIDFIAIKGDATVGAMEGNVGFRQIVLIAPQHIAARRVDCINQIARRGDEHHAIVDDRRRFMTA